MKFYGEKNLKRGLKVGEISYKDFNDVSSAIGFIREHGLFGEYVSRMRDEVDDEISIDTDPENVDMESIEYEGNRYWYGTNCFDTVLTLGMDRKIGIYRELPDVYDDKIFHWKLNKKYGSMECVIEENLFEYHCIYKADGNAVINVKYTACDNLHKNKVTISTIEIEYATNTIILKAIKKWKKSFREALER
jgi:hypothetical protein